MRKLGALVLVLVTTGGCIEAAMPPPMAGYGAPYRGTGEPIVVEDGREAWTMTEGSHALTSEQALEAVGDREYEVRRQIARDHNVRLYREGQAHRTRGNLMTGVGLGVMIVGVVLARLVAPQNLGVGVVLGGLVVSTYGYYGGKRPPPYVPWQTPAALNRPAYVRQQTETYNEQLLGAHRGPAMPPMRGPR